MKSTEPKSFGERLGRIVGLVLLVAGLLGAALVARRNYRHGRGDREGARRLAAVIFLLQMALFFCLGHFSAIGDAIGLTMIAISTALFIAAMIWLLYIAVEPFVRRHWPKTIISWSRLLAGGWRDAVVGRDVLLGVALGVVWILIFGVRDIKEIHMGAAPALASTKVLIGGRRLLGVWLQLWPQSIQGTLFFFLLLLGLKVLLRKEWIAAVAFVAIFAVPRGLTGSYTWVELPTQIIVYAIALLIVVRFGLVPLACAIFTVNLVGALPFSADLSMWYMPNSIFALLSVVALAGWGFYHSLGGQKIWSVEGE